MKKIYTVILLIGSLISINSYAKEYIEDSVICPITINEIVKKVNLTHTDGKELYNKIKNNCESGVYRFYSLIRYYNSHGLSLGNKSELYNEFITINSELSSNYGRGLDKCSEFLSIMDTEKEKLINDCRLRVIRDDRIRLVADYPSKGSSLNIKQLSTGNKGVDYNNSIIENYSSGLCLKENCGITFSLILGSSSIPNQYKHLSQMLIVSFDKNQSYKRSLYSREYGKYNSNKEEYLNKLASDKVFACDEIKNYISDVLKKTGKIKIDTLCN